MQSTTVLVRVNFGDMETLEVPISNYTVSSPIKAMHQSNLTVTNSHQVFLTQTQCNNTKQNSEYLPQVNSILKSMTELRSFTIYFHNSKVIVT